MVSATGRAVLCEQVTSVALLPQSWHLAPAATGSSPSGDGDTALTDEYVRGKEAAVGTFFTANEISQPEQAILNAFEDHIRNATDKQAEIGKLSEKWGLDLVIESAR
ncbi:unnamed protein product [Polarella glacialis]|uniref:Uncharacterized protein n=1 Tax=Polarella glacialis TaxID=89957 RepID=A0A813K3J9_POLGL|nr:unnamed protein product [Polarella glacialis]